MSTASKTLTILLSFPTLSRQRPSLLDARMDVVLPSRAKGLSLSFVSVLH